MSIDIWPRLPPDELKAAVEATKVSEPLGHRRLPSRSQYTMADWILVENPFNPPIPLLTEARHLRQDRELEWLLGELHSTLTELRHGLEDCYALLAPVDPGSTLVVSTPRNEIVKGHITRVGTRIVKGVRSPPALPLHRSILLTS